MKNETRNKHASLRTDGAAHAPLPPGLRTSVPPLRRRMPPDGVVAWNGQGLTGRERG